MPFALDSADGMCVWPYLLEELICSLKVKANRRRIHHDDLGLVIEFLTRKAFLDFRSAHRVRQLWWEEKVEGKEDKGVKETTTLALWLLGIPRMYVSHPPIRFICCPGLLVGTKC